MDRQAIMETNRSLRNIKNELENLLEKGVIDEAAFDTIHSALPAETPLRGAAAAATGTPSNRSANPTPTQNAAPTSPPTQAFQSLGLNKSNSPAPPSYDETPPPDVPSRSAKPVLVMARALYNYKASAPDARDLTFERGDLIDVHQYMNNDWWMGRNQRTGQEGIFPSNHVNVEQKVVYPPAPAAAYAPQPAYGYPASQGPPPQQNPYNASVPPMAVAEGGQPSQPQGSDSKVGEYGKKFGKKLGNAAIFGAGASIGSNIVNSIF